MIVVAQEVICNRICKTHLSVNCRETIEIFQIRLYFLPTLLLQIYLSVLENTYLHTDVLLNNGDTVFVSHRDGYTSGSIVESLPDDVFRVRLFPSKQMLDVSVDDIHKVRLVCVSINYMFLHGRSYLYGNVDLFFKLTLEKSPDD